MMVKVMLLERENTVVKQVYERGGGEGVQLFILSNQRDELIYFFSVSKKVTYDTRRGTQQIHNFCSSEQHEG